jgi:hypothetical protein
MLQPYIRIAIFWTLLLHHLTVASDLYAFTHPPVLGNPSVCGLGLPINDLSCDANHDFNINVLQTPGNVLGTDVFLKEVRLIVKHEWVADLDISLISPSGVEVNLSSDNGSGNDNYGDPDNGLCNAYTSFISHTLPGVCTVPSIVDGSAPFIGNYLPEESLGRFNDHTNPVGLWTLRICDDGKDHYGTLEFVELVFESSACLPPSQVIVLSADSTFAKFDWVPGSNCAASIIEFGPAGFTPGLGGSSGGGSIRFASCPPYTISGLQPSRIYEFYIREHCGAGVFSPNTCPVTLTTTCSPPPPTLIEHFNGQTVCETVCGNRCPLTGLWSNASDDNFDWLVNAGPSTTSQTGPDDDVPGGGNYLYIETSGSLCRTGNVAMLYSDCLDVVAGPDSCDMSFNYIMYGIHVNRLSLEATTDGGKSWQLLWSAAGNQGSQWRKKFIDLDVLQGQTTQFRFVGEGGNGFRGDIALDNILFYGAVKDPGSSYVYYRDEDGDGYGNREVFFTTCQAIVPPFGYTIVPDDCDDFDNTIYPGAPEIPCNGIDENCNGDEDENYLSPLTTVSDTVCNSEPATLVAKPLYDGQVFWYNAETGGDPLHLGDLLFIADPPVNTSPHPVEVTYFVEEITPDSCVSAARSPVKIVILPTPNISAGLSPSGCAGAPFDLNTVDVIDGYGVNGTISYFDETWTSIPSLISPVGTSLYHIVSTGLGGCRDTTSVVYTLKPSPDAYISGDSTLCFGQVETLTAFDEQTGNEPLTFTWNSGQTTSSIEISNDLPVGQSKLLSVLIKGSNGCSDTDSMLVKSVTSISAVQIATTSETICNGGDGKITLTPTGGTAPYTYQWTGGGQSTLPGLLVLNALSQGTYAFTVTDSGGEGCPYLIPVVIIDGPTTTTTVSNITPVSCFGGNNGCIELEVVGTNPSIAWSTGGTGELVCGLKAGSYSVTVTDGNCMNVLTIPVTEPTEPLFANPLARDVSCYGYQDGSLDLTIQGGTSPYQSLWSNGLTTEDAASLAAGTYTVSITDAKGCQLVMRDLPVVQPAPLSLDTLLFMPPSCYGSQDGQLAIAPQGGLPPYTLTWNNGGTGSVLTNLALGDYTVSMTDGKGCSDSKTIRLPQPLPVEIIKDYAIQPSCNGLNNGTIGITVSGGNGAFTYRWSNGSTLQDLAGVGSGMYQVTVTDRLGCTAVSDAVNLPGPEFMNVNFDLVHPPCVGRDEGSIQVKITSGGVPPFQYYWNTDDSKPLLQGLAGGNYTVTIVDGNGCRLDTTVTLIANQIMSADVAISALSCFENASGRLDLTLMGGMSPYNISWSTGQQGPSIAGLPSANYQATVTDNNGCKFFSGPLFVGQPSKIIAKVNNIEDNACYNDADGNIFVNVIGGTPPYAYLWSNQQSTRNATGLAEGVYSLTVTDANGCVTDTGPVNVTSPDAVQAFLQVPVPEDCQSFYLDTACISVTGGTSPYQFNWGNGRTSSCLTGVVSGDYHVTITDGLGCVTELESVKILETFSPVKVKPLPVGAEKICPGTNDGMLAVVIEKGIGPYQFIWSNGEKGLTPGDTIYINQLTTGLYNVTITDNIGCTAVSDWMKITTDGYVTPTIPGSSISHVTCKSGADGSVLLNVSGGKAPYTYYWTDINGVYIGDSVFVEGLKAGTYSVLVTDLNGCTGTAEAVIHEPSSVLRIDELATILKPVSCFGGKDGKIDISPAGGVPPYAFLWSNGATTEDVFGLGPGQFVVTVTDSNACLYQSPPLEVLSPSAPLQLIAAIVYPVSCYGGSDGSIDVEVTGGTTPYYYTWSNVGNQEDLSDKPAGVYTLVLSDANLLCTIDTFFAISQPEPLIATLHVTSTEEGLSNGRIIAEVSGGTAPYVFYWNNGQTGDTLANVPAGDYALTVTDGNLCDTTIWATVPTLVAAYEKHAIEKVVIYPNPSSGQFNVGVTVSEDLDFTLKVFSPVGQHIFSTNAALHSQAVLPVDLGQRPPGMYLVTGWVNGVVVWRAGVLLLE